MDDAFYCPQCGDYADALFEGYCKSCREDNQRRLDHHNASFDRWESMTDRQRQDEIKRAWRNA